MNSKIDTNVASSTYAEQVAVERDRLVANIKRHVREDGVLVDKGGRVVKAYSGRYGYRPIPFSREYFLSKFDVDLLAGRITNLKTGKVYTPNKSDGKTQIWVDGAVYKQHLLIVWLALSGSEFDQIPVALVANHLDVDGGDAITNLELTTTADNSSQRSAVQKDSAGYNPLIGCNVMGVHGTSKNPRTAPFYLSFASSITSKVINLCFRTELEMTTVAEWLYYGDIDTSKPINVYRDMLTARKQLICELHKQCKVICNSKQNTMPIEISSQFKPAVEIERIVRNARTDNPRLFDVMGDYIKQGFTGFISKHTD